MKIEKLQVTNFRNLDSNIISFGPGINCIFGKNGNGKTNILEAVYFLIHKKSFRKNASFPQMISIDGENSEILFSSLFGSEESNEKLSFSGKVSNEGNVWHLDGKPIKKKLGFGAVFINPFDSQQFHTSASFRRVWMDTYLSQISPSFKTSLGRYSKLLRHRNKLLSKKPSDYQKQIKAIDVDMASLSVEITKERILFIQNLNNLLKSTFFDLFSKEHELTLNLDSKFIDKNEDYFHEVMLKNWEKDSILGRTSYGIHRDDYIFLFDGLNSYDYCSLGQQKMAYLSLLFAYTELFRYKVTTFPIVLLDDVSGELDDSRWQYLIQYLGQKKFQVLITTANENFKEGLDSIEGAIRICVTSGAIQNI